jgi:hypothetical protein
MVEGFQLPTIRIIEPEISSIYGSHLIPPNFTLEISDPNHNSTWYQINSDLTKYFVNSSGIIDYSTWMGLSDGKVQIKFYANDSYGNINSNNVTIIKDTIKPNITINKPTIGNLFGSIAPEFEIHVEDITLDTIWYAINNGATNYTFFINGSLNQLAWNSVPSGLVTIIFYANDSLGREEFNTVSIEKDAIMPIVNLITPLDDTTYTDDYEPPNFIVEIFDIHLHQMWYTISSNSQKYFFSVNDSINDTAWMSLPEGNVTISFYANDTAGNMDYSQVIVRKDAFEPEITIINPLVRQNFGRNPPQFNISVIEETSITCWYQVAGDITQYEFIGTTGTIDEEVWNGLHEGQVMITFYAKDEANNIGSAMINIVKELPKEFSIGGYDVFWIITIIGLTVLVLDSRKRGSW